MKNDPDSRLVIEVSEFQNANLYLEDHTREWSPFIGLSWGYPTYNRFIMIYFILFYIYLDTTKNWLKYLNHYNFGVKQDLYVYLEGLHTYGGFPHRGPRNHGFQ